MLVLLWAGPPAPGSGPLARAYRGMLDLEGGRPALRRCEGAWRHYGEVVLNRKSKILELAAARLRGAGAGAQAAVLGCGMDSLSMELACLVPGAAVYDVDRRGMGLKRRLVDAAARSLGGAAAAAAGRIRCVPADLEDARGVGAALRGSGWDPGLPTVAVAEGVSYYIPRRSLSGLAALFGTPGLTNSLVLEYLVPRGSVEAGRAGIPDAVFDALLGDGASARLVRYDAAGALSCAGRARLESRFTMRQMELDRTGRNEHFAGERSGWIEVCLLAV